MTAPSDTSNEVAPTEDALVVRVARSSLGVAGCRGRPLYEAGHGYEAVAPRLESVHHGGEGGGVGGC